jgi:hypothetical protein
VTFANLTRFEALRGPPSRADSLRVDTHSGWEQFSASRSEQATLRTRADRARASFLMHFFGMCAEVTKSDPDFGTNRSQLDLGPRKLCANYLKEVVGRDGIEPPTPGFSVPPCPTLCACRFVVIRRDSHSYAILGSAVVRVKTDEHDLLGPSRVRVTQRSTERPPSPFRT